MPPSNWSPPRLYSRANVRTLYALLEVLVPLDAAEVPYGSVDLVARIEAVLHGENPAFGRGSRLSLAIIEWTPALWGFGFTRFSNLPLPERTRCVQRWEGCGDWRIRNLFYGCKVMILSVLYDDPSVAAAVGYR